MIFVSRSVVRQFDNLPARLIPYYACKKLSKVLKFEIELTAKRDITLLLGRSYQAPSTNSVAVPVCSLTPQKETD